MSRGCGFWEVVEQPYHETLYEFMALTDIDRISRFIRDGEAMRSAEYMAYAFNAPDKLAEVWKEKEAQYEMEQNPYLRESERETALAKARNILAAMEGKEFKELTPEEIATMTAQGILTPFRGDK
jgi:hypothetical protein